MGLSPGVSGEEGTGTRGALESKGFGPKGGTESTLTTEEQRFRLQVEGRRNRSSTLRLIHRRLTLLFKGKRY